MDQQIKFDDTLSYVSFNSPSLEFSFGNQIDYFSNFFPTTSQTQEFSSDHQSDHSSDQQKNETEITRKNSFKSESIITEHDECKIEDNIYEEPQNKKSNHHNFQKHTVTALKDLVKQAKFQELSESPESVAIVKTLWKSFLRTKGKSIMTKKFLSILFRSDLQSVSQLKIYGFEQIFKEYEPPKIRQGKNELKKLVIKFLDQKAIEQHVGGREIKRKEQFRLYLINFRHQLENNNIKKRISRQSSDWITVNAQVFDCLN